MASAELTYVDPSALRSLYIHDDRSARFCAFRRRIVGALPITRFGRAEIINSIHLAVYRNAIDRDSARAATAEATTTFVMDGSSSSMRCGGARSISLPSSAKNTRRRSERVLSMSCM